MMVCEDCKGIHELAQLLADKIGLLNRDVMLVAEMSMLRANVKAAKDKAVEDARRREESNGAITGP